MYAGERVSTAEECAQELAVDVWCANHAVSLASFGTSRMSASARGYEFLSPLISSTKFVYRRRMPEKTVSIMGPTCTLAPYRRTDFQT